MSGDAKLEINRRGFVRGTLATGALLMAARSAQSWTLAAGLNPERHFAPVKVARNRIISWLIL